MSDASWTAFWMNLPAIIAAVGAIYAAFKSKEAAAGTKDVKDIVKVIDRKTEDQNVVLQQAAVSAAQTETNTNGSMDRMMKLVERMTDPGMPGGQRATDPPQKE